MAALAEKADPPRRPDPVRWVTCLFLLVLISPALLVAILLSVVGIAVVGLIGMGRRIWSLCPVGGLVRQPTASRSGPDAARP